MAKGRIQGITIELNGETKGLNSALKGVNQQSSKLTTELRDVEKLLKFNPGNTEALAQKQQLLTKQIEATTQKLDQLKQAESQVEAQFKSGEIGEEQYRAFKREIEYTEGALNGYKGQLSKVQTEQESLEQNTKRINTLFEATGSSVDDYADILGGRLTTAIKTGTATSDQLEQAINKIGRAALGTDVDVGKMKTALDAVDDGAGIQNVEADLRGLSTQSDQTAEALESMGDKLDLGNMMEGSEQIGEVGDKLLDLGKDALESATDIDSAANRYNNSFGLTGAEAAKTKDKIVDLYNTGLVDSYEEASDMMIQTRNQLRGLNGESLDSVTKKAVAFSKTFDSDMTESLRGANALMTTYGMSADDAFDLMTVGAQNGLNKTDELGDNLAEYATLFEENGYSAEDMFTILQSGLEGGAYNLDKVNDLVKEFGIRIADGSVEKAVGDMGGSFEKTFKRMKKSGASNKDIFQALVGEVSKLKTEQEKAAAISSIFGSLGEDAGIKVIESMGGASKAVKGIKGSYDDAKGAAEKLTKANDAQKLTKVWHELQSALTPIGTDILNALMPVIDIIKKLADGFKGLPEPVRQFIEIFGGMTVLAAVLAPIIAAVVALGSTFGIIIAVIAAVAAAIVGVIAVVKNWGAIVEWLKGVWGGISDFFSTLWEAVKLIFSAAWEAISQWLINFMIGIATNISNTWNGIAQFLSGLWNSIVSVASGIFGALGSFFSGVWNGIKSITSGVWNGIKGVISTVWGFIVGYIKVNIYLIKTVVTTVWNAIKSVTSSIWNGIKSVISAVWNGIKSGVRSSINGVKSVISSVWNAIKSVTSSVWNGIKSVISGVWNGIKSFVSGAVNGVKGTVSGVWNAIKSVTSSVWNGIKNAISTPLEKAKSVVKKVIDAIKGFFGFKIKWPHIPMPHFGISPKGWGVGDLLKGKIPKLSLKWFAKGGILTKPTAFGMSGGSVMAGGEAGNEAVLPLNAKNLGVIGQMIAQTMPPSGDNYEFTFNVNGNIDQQMIALLKKELQKVLVDQTRRKDSSRGGVSL